MNTVEKLNFNIQMYPQQFSKNESIDFPDVWVFIILYYMLSPNTLLWIRINNKLDIVCLNEPRSDILPMSVALDYVCNQCNQCKQMFLTFSWAIRSLHYFTLFILPAIRKITTRLLKVGTTWTSYSTMQWFHLWRAGVS